MIEYRFDNANAEGDKEPQVPPNAPELKNKLSANEINGIKDKVNEIITYVVPKIGGIKYGTSRLKLKGEGNEAEFLEVGDIVEGYTPAGKIINNGVFGGGTDIVELRENKQVLREPLVPTSFILTDKDYGTDQIVTKTCGFTLASITGLFECRITVAEVVFVTVYGGVNLSRVTAGGKSIGDQILEAGCYSLKRIGLTEKYLICP